MARDAGEQLDRVGRRLGASLGERLLESNRQLAKIAARQRVLATFLQRVGGDLKKCHVACAFITREKSRLSATKLALFVLLTEIVATIFFSHQIVSILSFFILVKFALDLAADTHVIVARICDKKADF